MSTLAHLPDAVATDSDANPQLNIVLAYADLNTALRGKKVHDRLVDELGHECKFTLRLWGFDALKSAQLRTLATKDAADADMLVISTHGGHDLPRAVKIWMETSVKEKQSPAALLALVDGNDDTPDGQVSVRDYLSDVARRAKMEFFWHSGERPTAASGHWGRVSNESSEHEDALDNHWGINE